MRCALWIKLYCTDVSCEWVSCLHTPRRYSGIPSFSGNEITTIYQDDVEYQDLQLVCHCEFCYCEVEDEDAADGFPHGFSVVPPSSFSDKRIFLLLRMVDLLVDVVDVLDVSVSKIVCVLRHCFNAKANSGRCRRRFLGPISIQTKNPMFGVL